MSRIKTAFLSGTITDNPLSAAATTINSAALANLPAIASPDIAVLVLDPAGSAGAPEVVWVTAHTGSATSATISRAQEGTSAREHASTIPWVQGPTIMDFAQRKGSDIASAGTLTLPSTDEDYFDITGTTTITAISARAAGKRITLQFDGACQITHNVTSLKLIGGANIITAAGDILEFISEDSGNWRQVGVRTPTYASSNGAGVTLAAQNTYYDSGSISLTMGTWLVIASVVSLNDSVGLANLIFAIRDGANNIIQDGNSITTTSANVNVSSSKAVIVSPTSTTTYKASASNTTRASGVFEGHIVAVRLY